MKGHRQAGLPVFEQIVIPLVGLLGGSESAELTHGPELAAVHVLVNAAGVRWLPGVPKIARVVQVAYALGRVDLIDRDARDRCEGALADVFGHEGIIGGIGAA